MRKFSIYILVVVFLAAGIFFLGRERPREIELKEHNFGGISIDLNNRVISFEGRIKKTSGRVLFPIHLRGYEWLEEYSFIVSDARLSDMQKAFALLDWQLWDDLYIQNSQEARKRTSVVLKQGVVNIDATQLVLESEAAKTQMIFYGHPAFDAHALSESKDALCVGCPVFPLEKRAILSAVARPEGFILSDKIGLFDKNKNIQVSIYVD